MERSVAPDLMSGCRRMVLLQEGFSVVVPRFLSISLSTLWLWTYCLASLHLILQKLDIPPNHHNPTCIFILHKLDIPPSHLEGGGFVQLVGVLCACALEICKNGTANIGLCSFDIGSTFHRHRWSHSAIHWEWQNYKWSMFTVLILQFFLLKKWDCKYWTGGTTYSHRENMTYFC